MFLTIFFIYGRIFDGPDLTSLFLCNCFIQVINENFQTVILLVLNEIWARNVHFAAVHFTIFLKLLIIFHYYLSSNMEYPESF